MITKEQAQRIKSYVESLLVYETLALDNKISLAKSEDKASVEFLTYVLELNQYNAEQTGKQFLSYIDSLTEGEWIEWSGGECPLENEEVRVEYRTALGSISDALACDLRWYWTGLSSPRGGDITAYKIFG